MDLLNRVNPFDALMIENVLTMPFTGMRLIIFLAILIIVLLMCRKIVISRLPLHIRMLFHAGVILLIPLVFVAEMALLSHPSTVEPKRLRESKLCLTVLSATVTYGKGVYMLTQERRGEEPRYVHVLWEVRFAQAMSRTLEKFDRKKDTIMLGGASCAKKKGAATDTNGSPGDSGSEGIQIIENFPTPYPDKVDLEG